MAGPRKRLPWATLLATEYCNKYSASRKYPFILIHLHYLQHLVMHNKPCQDPRLENPPSKQILEESKSPVPSTKAAFHYPVSCLGQKSNPSSVLFEKNFIFDVCGTIFRGTSDCVLYHNQLYIKTHAHSASNSSYSTSMISSARRFCSFGFPLCMLNSIL